MYTQAKELADLREAALDSAREVRHFLFLIN